MNDKRREFAVEVASRLRAAGHQALWAGGCVRDLILGLTPSDYDVATDATPERVMALFRRTVPVGVSFGVVRVLGPREAGEVEVATFRSDGAYVDGRRPESVTFSSPEEDAARRDFTINGMFLDPLTDEVIDFVGGRADLDARVLRAIGDPSARFEEDKLRLIRAVRFAARFNMAIDPATRSAIERMAPQVCTVSAERIAQELRRMLVHPSRAKAMALASEVALASAVLPEVAPIDDRTLRALDCLPDEPSFTLSFATLLGDVGGRVAGQVARRLKLSNEERERIAWLVEHREALASARTSRAAALKRLLARPGIIELLALHRARALATAGDLDHVAYCEHYLRDEPHGPIDPPPLVTGADLIALGLRPGPEFAAILEATRDAQLDGEMASKPEAIALIRRSHGVGDPGGST